MPQTPARVLIIDDDVSTIRLMADALSSDYEVVIATQAEEGFVQALHSRPDLILLDVVMPDMNGFDFCRKLKADARTQPIPVIFVSALDTVSEQARGFELGCVDYITKPIAFPILLARVKTHTRLYRQTLQLESLAATDPLTGLANRRKFDECIQHEVARANRKRCSIALLIIDIDDFKPFNDHYGHGKGDDCLVRVARLLRKCVGRATDTVSRLGGEEFGVVLPDTDAEGAISLANEIITLFNEEKIPHHYATQHDYLTVSIGVGILDDSKLGEASIDPRSLIDVADEALYQAKENGRNCSKVQVLQPLSPTGIVSNL